MLSIEELIQSNIVQTKLWLEKLDQSIENKQKFTNNFCYHHILLAVNSLKQNDLVSWKQNLFTSACIDELQILNYNSRLFDYGLYKVCYAVLSDNEPLIQRYAILRYQRGVNAELSMNEMVEIGLLPIWCNTVQFFIANDIEGVERNLNIIECKALKKLPKREEILKDDYDFYKALHSSDKAKMEEVLEKLTSPKIHKKRNDNPIMNKYISLPAIGYAKLAWRKGIEVEVKSNLVPKKTLPIRPLEKYLLEYDFLK